MDDIEIMIREVAGKESSVLCREVTSIGDAMDVIRSKWVPEILTAVITGLTADDVLRQSYASSTRVSDLKNKTLEQLKALRDIGLYDRSLNYKGCMS